MQRALAVDPAARYATARELRDALLAVNVVTQFSAADISDGALARWTALVPAGTAIVEVAPTPNATFSARRRLDRGAGSGPRMARELSKRARDAAARPGRCAMPGRSCAQLSRIACLEPAARPEHAR
jgi:hypothetical protein